MYQLNCVITGNISLYHCWQDHYVWHKPLARSGLLLFARGWQDGSGRCTVLICVATSTYVHIHVHVYIYSRRVCILQAYVHVHTVTTSVHTYGHCHYNYNCIYIHVHVCVCMHMQCSLSSSHLLCAQQKLHVSTIIVNGEIQYMYMYFIANYCAFSTTTKYCGCISSVWLSASILYHISLISI